MKTAHQLYFSADEIRQALKDLGPPGTHAESLVAVASETLAAIIEETGEMYAWDVEHYLSPEAARQASRPHVVLTRRLLEPAWEEQP